MKTNIGIPLLALSLTFSLAACKGTRSGGSSDSSKVDSTSVTKVDTSVKKDTTKMGTDTSKKKVDTVTKTTEEKKSKKKTY